MNIPSWSGNSILLIIEIAVLYTIGKSVNEYFAGQIIHTASKFQKMLLHFLFAPGVALHESSHAIVSVLLGGHIHKFVPYHPQVAEDGTSILFGYVSHSGTEDPVRGFAIGIAPLIGVPVLLLAIGSLIIPEASFGDGPFQVFKLALEHMFTTPLAILFVYLMISGSIGMLPSASDHRDIIPFTIITVVVVAAVVLLFPAANFSFLLPVVKMISELLVLPTLLSVSMFGVIKHRTAR